MVQAELSGRTLEISNGTEVIRLDPVADFLMFRDQDDQQVIIQVEGLDEAQCLAKLVNEGVFEWTSIDSASEDDLEAFRIVEFSNWFDGFPI